ncbi:hypothetical protein ACSTDX_14910 [Vibrio vulnificus]|uniref:hypothetical protein n=1 Tax=Vibrio vulnificus TaxID=672 RepID=UPI003ED84BE3
MIKQWQIALAALALTGCATTDTTPQETIKESNAPSEAAAVENSPVTEETDVYFVLGNVTSIYDIKLSLGSVDFETGRFTEDWFSSLWYRYTEDRRYILGKAKPGSFIAITSTKATDATGTHLGTFTPCNQTLVFRLPYLGPDFYVTDVNYHWHNTSISPVYSDGIEEAKKAFNVQYLEQAPYRQLDADLYKDCETLSADPTILTRPF